MTHLKKDPGTGHLLKNADGHLISGCPPPPGGYILTHCNICGGAHGDCDGTEATLTTTPALSPTLVPSDIGTTVKINGSTDCWSVTYDLFGVGTDEVVVAERFDDCEECCGKPYKLTQCYKSYSNTDCDGSASAIVVAPDNTNITDDLIGLVVRYDSKCWTVTRVCDAVTTAGPITVSGDYANCAACCDACTACGNCEFSLDSQVQLDLEIITCKYAGSPCSGALEEVEVTCDTATSASVGCVPGRVIWASFNLQGTVTKYWNNPVCDPPSGDNSSVTSGGTSVTVDYDCVSNEWKLGEFGIDTGITSCSGGSNTVEVCTGGGVNHRKYIITITVLNNSCSPWFDAP